MLPDVIARGVDAAARTPTCRSRCAACCIAPSITSPIPGMPNGKPAGVRCVQLLDDLRCAIFGRADRPAFCSSLKPAHDMCGETRDEALAILMRMEIATRPIKPKV